MASSSGKRIKTLGSKEKGTKRKEKEQFHLDKGEQALLRTLTSTFPERQFMSQDEFTAYVAWPADPAQEGDRVEAAEASTMDEDGEDEDSDEE
ncbi:hypothetical protein LR48_Vigan08g047600 [Vigna angularis]|uniref:Uncharacterized protein n=1 Tax=Phaseolus angularis TaxID=3914 RepID=A0A0L9V4L2_PHAAN|nr:hypothetical protein LR48_Vigan08g047600 [Vigna angularis]